MTSLLRRWADPVLTGELLPAALTGPAKTAPARVPVPIVSTRPSFLQSMQGGLENGGDKESQAAAMTANGTLYAITAGISFDVSATKWHLYRKSASGHDEDREEVTSHPSIELFEQPNPFMTGQEYFEVIQQHQELTGEGWSLTTFLGRVPLQLWPVYPHRMTPIPDPEAFLQGYVYASPDGQRIPLGLNEVTMLRQPHPLNLFRGLSAVQAIGTDLAAGRAASAWNDRFFTNSAVPGGIIEQDKDASALTDDEFRTFVQRWRETHQGVQNAHRVAVLEVGMKWVANQYSLKDLQFVELRGMSRDIVREAYRYPSAYLGTVEDANRANMEAQAVFYAEAIKIPRLTRWKAWRNRKIMPLFGDDWRQYEWDFEDPTPPNSEADNAMWTAKSTAAKTFIDAGFDGNDVIKGLELPETLGAWTKPEPPAPALPPGGGSAPKKAAAASFAFPAWLTREIDGHADALVDPDIARAWHADFARRARNEAPPDELEQLQEEWARQRADAVAQWQSDVQPDQIDALAEQVEQGVDGGDLALLAALVAPVLGVDLLAGYLAAMASAGALSVVGAAPVVIAAGVVPAATIAEQSAATAGLLAQALSGAAGREALRVAQPGVGGAEVANRVRAFLDGLSTRSLLDQIGGALTRAQNAGRIGTYERVLSQPPPGWQVTLYADERLDGNTCRPCREIDGKILPTIDAANLAYGGAGYLWCEGGVRCRGTVFGLWTREDEQDGA